ncbi:hypothetical protein ACN42_g642 [Penicillium freii]|uniref:Uncharacterized protein n=1 Tax=Penicillium freii TaxID=48697 RepID=A0A117NS50_PENFR|nr:hypothetical protein ACN42_g642 [Penicillium freii]
MSILPGVWGKRLTRPFCLIFLRRRNTGLYIICVLNSSQRFVLFPLILVLLLCDEPTLFSESGTLDCPSENYTLLRYHIAVLAIDDLYNYAQSTQST